MKISGIPARSQTNPSTPGESTPSQAPISEPPSSSATPGDDAVQISSEAHRMKTYEVPESVTSAVIDLKGSQATMAADFRAIGDYFVNHGGREALDSFMRANFTENQLRAFPPPVDGARVDPAPPGFPVNVVKPIADLQGQGTSMGDDLRAIGDYFRDHGGQEAHRAFMKANFTDAQRDAFKAFHEAAVSGTTSS